MDNADGGIVREWYETKQNVDEMKRWERPKLKIWENRVAASFPRNARILDIGCGMGREAFALTDMGFRVTGIDISNEVIEQAGAFSAERGYSIPFCAYDGHTLPFKAETFDVVIIWAQTFGLVRALPEGVPVSVLVAGKLQRQADRITGGEQNGDC